MNARKKIAKRSITVPGAPDVRLCFVTIVGRSKRLIMFVICIFFVSSSVAYSLFLFLDLNKYFAV